MILFFPSNLYKDAIQVATKSRTENPQFINESSFKSRAGYIGAGTVYNF